MQKLVIDTNVIVSALISKKGIPAKILNDIILDEKAIVCTSDSIIKEYLDVLSREKFARFKDFKANADIVISILKDISLHKQPSQSIELLNDIDDNKFLELAVEVKADYIITGNTKDFTISNIEQTKIVTPTAYWEQYKPEESQ